MPLSRTKLKQHMYTIIDNCNKMSLFKPTNLGQIKLKNKIVMAPMTRSRAINNVPNDLMRTYYSQRSSAGLIITEQPAARADLAAESHAAEGPGSPGFRQQYHHFSEGAAVPDAAAVRAAETTAAGE